MDEHALQIINLIRDYLIAEYGEEFLSLTERDQNLVIYDELQKHIKQ